MNKHIKITSSLLLAAALFTQMPSCKKPDDPKPVEQELITTIVLKVGDSANVKTYKYKVENGMGQGGSITIDSIVLPAGKGYPVSIQVLNEKENPAEDITTEIVAEREDHLFVWESNPVSGAGSLIFSGGSVDTTGKPFNHKGQLTTGTAGGGNITVTLKHLPTNKNAATAAAAGGSTDAEAKFPVRIY